MTIPGLPAEDLSYVTASSSEDFHGGEDVAKKILSQEEYDRIEKIFRDQLMQSARESFRAGYSPTDDFIPLPIAESIHVLDMTLQTDAAVGSYVEQVTFFGKADFMVYLYHAESLRENLLASARSHLLEDTESLIEISKNSPDVIEVLKIVDDPWSIKVTARVPVQILYDFSSESGQKTIQNTLSDLLDSDVERAEKTLLNHPYIKAIDIRLTPFWANKLPNSLERIYIKVLDISY